MVNITRIVLPLISTCANETLAAGSRGFFPVEILNCKNISLTIPVDPSAPLSTNGNLTIVNAGPCVESVATKLGAFTSGAGGVIVFGAAPHVIYNKFSFQITLFASGRTSNVVSVDFADQTNGS